MFLSVRSSFSQNVLSCMSPNQAQKSTELRVWELAAAYSSRDQAQKYRGACMRHAEKFRRHFCRRMFSVRSSFDDEILRRDESRPRSSIPSAVLARGKTTYRRKRSRQNLVLIYATRYRATRVLLSWIAPLSARARASSNLSFLTRKNSPSSRWACVLVKPVAR